MKFNAWLATVALILLAGAMPADALPKKLAYLFYVDGQPVGRSDIKVTQSPGVLRFESKTYVAIGPNVIELACVTDADPRTYAVREFSMEGTKGGQPVAARVYALGDSVHGYVVTGGDRREKARRLPHPGTIVFEDWVMELEILLALTQARSTHVSDTYNLVFAGSFLPTDVVAGYTSEILVEAGSRSMAARKLAVAIKGADPFESHVDPNRGVPVYLQFPQVRAEIFLEEVFGDNPVSRFSTTGKGDK